MKKLLSLLLVLLGLGLLLVVLNPAFAQRIGRQLFGDPDMPDFAQNVVSKEEFMLRRTQDVAFRRGLENGVPVDPAARSQAIRKLETQERLVREMPDSPFREGIIVPWTEIGPAPIPNGQVSGGTPTPVSGRTISILIHPTNPNIVYVGTAQGGLYRTTDGGTIWTPLMDSAESLAVGALTFDPANPETLWVGTGEQNFSADSFFGVGVYKITNASTTANLSGPFNQNGVGANVMTGRAVSRIIMHPTNPNIMFASTASGVGGLVNVNLNIRPDPGIYRSTNATSANPTFEKLTLPGINNNVPVRDMAIDPDNPDVLIANTLITGGGIIRTVNATAPTPTFTQVQTFTGATSDLTAEFAAFQPSATADATFYAATGFGNGRVLRSTDGGATWTQRIDNNFCNPQCFYDIAIAVDPTNVDIVYLGGSPTIVSAKSINGGTSFTDNNAGVHVDTHAVAVAPSNPNIVWFGTDGGIYKSTNAGLTYTPMNNTTFRATQFTGLAVHSTDPNYTIGGTQDNGTNFFRVNRTWHRTDAGDGGYAVIDQSSTNTTTVTMYHTYFNQTNAMAYARVLTTAEAEAETWTLFGCGFGGTIPNGFTCAASAIRFYAPMEQGPGTPNTLYFGSDVLYRSSDAGTTMLKVSQEPIQSGQAITAIGIASQNDNIRVVGLANGGLLGTSTGANPLLNLDPANTVPDLGVARAVIDPNTATTAYVTLSGFAQNTIFRTTNLNAAPPTWTAIQGTGGNTVPQIPVNAFLVDPANSNRLYAGTDIGVYFSNDAGVNWLPLGSGLPRVAVFDMAFTSAGNLRIATHGRGMWEFPLQFTALGAFSRKTHGASGSFDVPLPFTGPSGVECRFGGVNGDYTIVVQTSAQIASASAAVTTGTGTVSSTTFSDGDIFINLTGVTDVQNLTVSLSNVMDTTGRTLPATDVRMAVLQGDVNGNRSVKSTDIAEVKSSSGEAANAGNFRRDVIANGIINSSDVSLTKTRSGAVLP